MKIGIFSDVHGNLEALNVCLARFQKEGIKNFVNCGDIIGYGPDSEACTKKISALPHIQSVIGNHDAVLVRPEIEVLFNYDAKVALDIGKATLSPKSVKYLSALPRVVYGTNFTAVHGTPNEPVLEYFSSIKQFYNNYNLWKGQICFVGHTHLPFYIKGTMRSCALFLNKKDDFTIALNPKFRYVINPGSVGKPRDNNPAASFGILDTTKKTFRFLRVPYNFKPTQEKMRAADYPSFVIDSLAVGL